MSKAKRYQPKKTHTWTYSHTQGTLLYLFLIPLFLALILALFQTNIKAFLLNGVSFFLFLAVAKLAKRGFRQEQLYHQSTLTKAPKIPYKLFAGYLLSLATFFTAFITGKEPLLPSVFLAVIAFIGYYLYYGFDPKEDKLENLGDVSANFVLETLKIANEKLLGIENNLIKIKDSALQTNIHTALQKAKHILKTIQEDPKDIRVARKFLIVYIDGIAKVTQSYVELDEKDITPQTKQRLHALMNELEEKLDQEHLRLKQNNAFDLDVHIDVLKEQIKG